MDLIKLDTILGIEELSDIEAERCNGGLSINADNINLEANNVNIVINEINANQIQFESFNV